GCPMLSYSQKEMTLLPAAYQQIIDTHVNAENNSSFHSQQCITVSSIDCNVELISIKIDALFGDFQRKIAGILNIDWAENQMIYWRRGMGEQCFLIQLDQPESFEQMMKKI